MACRWRHQDHHVEPALEPLRFGSFEEAAEVASSRFYAGIHYPFDNHHGRGHV
jgi:hypothetical protein